MASETLWGLTSNFCAGTLLRCAAMGAAGPLFTLLRDAVALRIGP